MITGRGGEKEGRKEELVKEKEIMVEKERGKRRKGGDELDFDSRSVGIELAPDSEKYAGSRC